MSLGIFGFIVPQTLRIYRCCPLLFSKDYLFFLLEDVAEASTPTRQQVFLQEFPTLSPSYEAGNLNPKPNPTGVMLSLIREERKNTPKECRELFNMYWQEPEVYVCDWILMRLNQGSPEVRLYKKNFLTWGCFHAM